MAKIIFQKELCTACGACSMACMNEHSTDISLIPPLRRVYKKETLCNGTIKFDFISSSCVHCIDPPCARICEQNCITRDFGLCLVILTATKCIRCGKCSDVCVNDAIKFYPDGTPEKCDGCISRQKEGLLPACVKACPSGALHI